MKTLIVVAAVSCLAIASASANDVPRGGGYRGGGGGNGFGTGLGVGLGLGLIGGALSQPRDIQPCAAYQAIVNEDVAGGVNRYNPRLYKADYARLRDCLSRQ